MPGKKIYFASDFHLGARYIENPIEYERRIVRWLDSIKQDAGTLYLLGDKKKQQKKKKKNTGM